MLIVCVLCFTCVCIHHFDRPQKALHLVTAAHVGACKTGVAADCGSQRYSLLISQGVTAHAVVQGCCGC